MSSVDNILTLVSEMSERQIDKKMVDKLNQLIGKSDEEVKTGLLEILDYCSAFSLANGFVVVSLHAAWDMLGGKPTDPAPWREHMYK